MDFIFGTFLLNVIQRLRIIVCLTYAVLLSVLYNGNFKWPQGYASDLRVATLASTGIRNGGVDEATCPTRIDSDFWVHYCSDDLERASRLGGSSLLTISLSIFIILVTLSTWQLYCLHTKSCCIKLMLLAKETPAYRHDIRSTYFKHYYQGVNVRGYYY